MIIVINVILSSYNLTLITSSVLNIELKVPFDSHKDQNVDTSISSLFTKPCSGHFSLNVFLNL